MNLACRLVLIVLLLAARSSTTHAQTAPATGQWETVLEINLAGEKPRKLTDSDCFTAKDRKDWQDALKGLSDGDCKITATNRKGNVLNFTERCDGVDHEGVMTIHSETHYSIVAKTNAPKAGTIKIEARRTSPICK